LLGVIVSTSTGSDSGRESDFSTQLLAGTRFEGKALAAGYAQR
jgi:hypothetical protein